MRTAICLYGQPRDALQKSRDILNRIIEPNSCDVFFHTWFNPSNLSINKMTPGHESRRLDSNLSSSLVEVFKPKNFSIEPQERFHHRDFEATEENIEACWPWSTCYDRQTFIRDKSVCIHSMWNSIMKSVLLKDSYSHQNGFKYDAVFLSRFDVSPTSKVLASEYDMSKVWVRNYEYPRREVSDWFLLSSDDNINVVGSTYFMIDLFYKRIRESATKIWTNEAFLRDHLNLHNIEVKKGNFNVTF